jgi:hypothetical protein
MLQVLEHFLALSSLRRTSAAAAIASPILPLTSINVTFPRFEKILELFQFLAECRKYPLRLPRRVEAKTALYMQFNFSGLLSGLIAKSLGDRQPDIDAFAGGLKKWAERD